MFVGTFVCFNICTVSSPEHIKLITNFRPGVRRISGVTEATVAGIWVGYSKILSCLRKIITVFIYPKKKVKVFIYKFKIISSVLLNFFHMKNAVI